VPAIVILTAMEAAGNSGISLIEDMDSGIFEKVLVSPTNRGAMFPGKALSEVILIIVQTVMTLVLGGIAVVLLRRVASSRVI
jgi:ABC-2 type transport system permease protein